jgi:hypothetical protein
MWLWYSLCTILHDCVLISVFFPVMYVACAPDFYISVCIAPVTEEVDPCNPSPCGPYSQCRNVNEQGVCSCLPTYIGSPPGCRPECVASSECPQNRACVNLKCVDPCPGPCGLNTRCETVNHSPICSCRQGFTGDSFIRCYAVPRKHQLILFLSSTQWSRIIPMPSVSFMSFGLCF